MTTPKFHGDRFASVLLPKARLITNAYYIGSCRNAQVARWDGTRFLHWREKFGHLFIEAILHPEDDQGFDCFFPVARVEVEASVTSIPLKEA